MITQFLARWGTSVRLAAALLVPFLVASCGSGGVSGPVPVNDPTRITILPDTAILYSGLATTFTVSGGTGSYIVSSSNQSVVPVSGTLDRTTFTVVPGNVTVDTAVTLTVRDTGTAPLATASLTVKPGTVANNIAIIPSANQGGNCAPAVCSGSDAVLTATLSQGGNPLPARGVRLDVISGDFRFITSQPNQAEVLEATTTVVTDQNGAIFARLRALPGAANQTAIVQVTDLGTNAFRRATFQIAQATGSSPGFFLVPDSVAFSGPNDQACASSGRADVYVFGGSPPYTVGNAGSAFGVSANFVSQSGGSFYIVPNGTCVDPGLPIPVVDSTGRTAILTASNVRGTQAVPDLVASPATVNLTDCTSQATVSVAGGTGAFTVSAGSGAIFASPNINSRLIAIGRVANTPATSPILVGVSSGNKSTTVTVNLSGDALNTRCDGSGMRVTPSSVTLATCGPVNAVVSGGTGPYVVAPDNSNVVATIGGSLITIRRASGSSLAVDFAANVIVTDSAGHTLSIPVAGPSAGTAAGTCP